MKANYQLAPSKAVVGEGTIYAYTNAILGKIVQVLIALILSKHIVFEPNSFMHMFNVSTL